MLHIKFVYGSHLLIQNENILGVLIHGEKKSPDGIHLSSSSFFDCTMLKRLSRKNKETFFQYLESAISECLQDAIVREKLEEK